MVFEFKLVCVSKISPKRLINKPSRLGFRATLISFFFFYEGEKPNEPNRKPLGGGIRTINEREHLSGLTRRRPREDAAKVNPGFRLQGLSTWPTCSSVQCITALWSSCGEVLSAVLGTRFGFLVKASEQIRVLPAAVGTKSFPNSWDEDWRGPWNIYVT